MRRMALAVLAAAIAAPLATLSPARAAAGASVPFATIASSSFSNWPQGAADVFIGSQKQWERVWGLHASLGATPPTVNFERFDVLALFMGAQTTGGFAQTVTSVTSNGNQVDVFVNDVSPGPGCAVIEVLTNPALFLRIPKLGLPVGFHHTPIAPPCP